MLVARDLEIKPPGAEVDPVVRGFSLDVDAGEWIAITGPNGCGKSCLALALGGLLPIAGGTLELDGVALHPRACDVRPGAIGVVLQEPASQLLQNTVADELTFTARNLDRAAREVEQRLAHWSARLGLNEWLEADPRGLSAGWQQAVLMAATMIAAPTVMVVDEGGAHLDGALRHRVLDGVREAVAAGLAVVWVSQEPEELAAADRVVDLGRPPAGVQRMPRLREALRTDGGRLLTLRVAPWNGEAGPFIRTAGELEIEIWDREIAALVGRNGCGKSVALAAAAGLIETAQIQPFWHVRGPAPPILTGQYPEQQIFSELIEEELIYAAVERGVPRAQARDRALQALATLNLGERFLSRRTWDLSTGEKRMVEIVAALIAPASLVLLDEPTCGLDRGRKFGLAKLIGERSRSGAVLVASQDISWVREVAGKVFELGFADRSKDAKYQQKNGLTQTCPNA